MPTPDGPQFSNFAKRDHQYKGPNADFMRIFNKSMSQTSTDDDGYVKQSYSGAVEKKHYDYNPEPGKTSAHVEVTHEGPSDDFVYPQHARYDDAWADKTTNGKGQIPLFTHESRPPTSTVSLVRGTKDARMQSMHLLALADVDTMVERGRNLQADSNLSAHSNRLVQKLEGKGSLAAPQNKTRNTLTFSDEPWESDAPDRTFTQGEVRTAKGRLRSVLRGQRKQKPQEQYEQPQLDLD
jgi:hypothetical protein